MGQVYPRVGLDCVGLGQKFSTFNESGWDGSNCKKSVLMYINITSIAYLHCLLRFLSGLVLLVPELVVCMGWIGSVRSWVGSSWINCWTCCMLHVGESRRTQHP